MRPRTRPRDDHRPGGPVAAEYPQQHVDMARRDPHFVNRGHGTGAHLGFLGESAAAK